MKLHHTGCACKDIHKTAAQLAKQFDAKCSDIVFDKNQNAELCMLTLKDGSQIELVSGDVVKSFVAKGVTYYHNCYSTPDIEATIVQLQDRGMLLVSPPKEAILFDNKRVAFLMSAVGLIELLENC